MHVVCVSYYYERFLTAPDGLLARYRTLTGWAEGLATAGARVSVVQRFGSDVALERNGVRYRFVRDPAWRFGSVMDRARRVNAAVAEMHPDVIHANGMHFARQAARAKRLLPGVPVLLQDHAGGPPRRVINRWTLRAALRLMDAVSFAAKEQATPWQRAGLLTASTPVFELMEGSSDFCLRDRAEAREETGLAGDPLCLWVGRLNANKDPLTALKGFQKALRQLPSARLVMVYSEDDLMTEVTAWLAANPDASAQVTLLGRLPHEALEAIYNSADFFLLGSHHEGSGYAALEALACGVTPLLTDIPSFRALTGNGAWGGLWPVEDVDALANTLLAWNARRLPDTPERVRACFEEHFSFSAIGRKAARVYASLLGGSRP